MTSFMIKEGTGTICQLASTIWQGPRVEVGRFISNSYHTLPFWYDKKISPFWSDWLFFVWLWPPPLFFANLHKITKSIWGNLCKLFLLPRASFPCIIDLFRLFEIRSNCIHVMNDSGLFLCLRRAYKFPSLVTLADSPILSHFQTTCSQNCADKISNQIGFGAVHL